LIVVEKKRKKEKRGAHTIVCVAVVGFNKNRKGDSKGAWGGGLEKPGNDDEELVGGRVPLALRYDQRK